MITFKKETWTQPISETLTARICEIAEKYSTYCGDCIVRTGNVEHYNASRYTCIAYHLSTDFLYFHAIHSICSICLP